MRSKELEQEWRDRIARAQHSGLTIGAFCKQEGISEQRYYAWRKRLPATETKPAFVEVPMVTRSDAQSTFELVCANGVVVRVPHTFDEEALRRLLRVVCRP